MPEGVLVADHHPLTRSGIRAALGRRGLRVLAEAADAEQAIAAAVARAPAACLVDASLPGGGIPAVAEIVPAVSTVAIVVTARAREAELLAAIRAGAVGYLPKA